MDNAPPQRSSGIRLAGYVLWFVLLAVVTAISISGCGGGARSTRTRAANTSPGALTERYTHAAEAVERFGHTAGLMEQRAVREAVMRYFKAVAAHEYYCACMMLTPQQRSLDGRPCVKELTVTFSRGFFRGVNARLAEVMVREVRVQAGQGYALIGTKASTEAEVSMRVRREGGRWRPDAQTPVPLHIVVE
jgi:hypothetical protein